MSEINLPKTILYDVPPAERIERSRRINHDPEQDGQARQESPKRDPHHDDADGNPPESGHKPGLGKQIDIIATPDRMADHTLDEIQQATDRVREMAAQLMNQGMSHYPDWFRELAVLESRMHSWLAAVDQSESLTGSCSMLEAMIGFRTQLRTFMDLFTDNVLYLQGVATILNTSRQAYDLSGGTTTYSNHSSHFDFRESR